MKSNLQNVLSRGVRHSIVIGRKSIYSLLEKSQQEQWKVPDKRRKTFQKDWNKKDGKTDTAQRDPLFSYFKASHFFSQNQFPFFPTSFCLPDTSCKTWNLESSFSIPMKICTWTIKLKDAYSEAPKRFWQQNYFWGLGKWPVSLISWGKPPQQSPQGQSSALHWTRNCKFWLLVGSQRGHQD